MLPDPVLGRQLFGAEPTHSLWRHERESSREQLVPDSVTPPALGEHGVLPLGAVYTPRFAIARTGALRLAQMPDRVCLFVDYQNAYQQARDLFHRSTDDHTCGQFRPWEMGELLCDRYNELRPNETALVLNEVRVDRGEPDRRRDARAHDAFLRQRAAWEHMGVQVRTATLQHGSGGPREKEIDVMLALDFVVGAIDRSYDVGVLFSFDRDFVPALNLVRERMAGLCRADVAGWGGIRSGRYLVPPGPPPIRHLFGKVAYERLADVADYTKPTSKHRRENQRRRRRR